MDIATVAPGGCGPLRLRALASLRVTQRELRLASGLTLLVYIATHLANHALGLWSIALAERGLRMAAMVWQSRPGTVLLYGAATLHVVLALMAIYRRRTLRMPPIELVRMALGLGIPTLLIGHAISTRVAYERYGHPADYAHVVWTLWHSGRQGMQLALLVPGWLHGCLGLRLAFGRRPGYARIRRPLAATAVLLPALAVAGFLSMGRQVMQLAQSPSWTQTVLRPADPQQLLALDRLRDATLLVYASVIAAVLLARGCRGLLEKRRAAAPNRPLGNKPAPDPVSGGREAE